MADFLFLEEWTWERLSKPDRTYAVTDFRKLYICRLALPSPIQSNNRNKDFVFRVVLKTQLK